MDLPIIAPAAFTLVELLIAASILLFVVIGILSANLFGMRMFQIAQTKFTAADAARKTLGKISDDIRDSTTTWVGNTTNGNFVGHLDRELQMGNALLIYPTTNTTNFILYYVNPADQTLRRTTSPHGSTLVLASCITNSPVFQAQNYLGQTLTNNQNHRVIFLSMQCYHPQSYLPTSDYYKLETTVVRRAQ